MSRARREAPSEGALLELAGTRFDLRHRALVMGILNRTTHSFYDAGAHYDLDAFLCQAQRLVEGGADILDVGGREGGVGAPEVSEAEETDRVTSSIEALRRRFDVPLSVDTWRAGVAAAAFACGAVLGNDMSGFRDPGYLPAAAAAGAAVVATHMRRPPGVPDPDPVYTDVVGEVAGFLQERVRWAEAAGIPRRRIVVDPGLDLGKTWRQSLVLLRHPQPLVDLGRPVLLAASNKIFLGRLLALDVSQREAATVAASALGIARGYRVLRVHDARAGRRVADTLAAVLAARPSAPEAHDPGLRGRQPREWDEA